MASTAPDYAGPVLGWRVWNVVEDGEALRLCSLLYHQVWRPGEEAVARCRRPLAALPWARLPLHGPPSHDCVCGIYALRAPAEAERYLTASPGPGRGPVGLRVLGQVALWGRVVESEHGWRAGFGYPERILVPAREHRCRIPLLRRRAPSPGEIASALAEYGVPVAVVERPAEALAGAGGADVGLKLPGGKPMVSPWAERLQLGESSSRGMR